LPAAIVRPWPESPEEIASLIQKADSIAIGPGLGNNHESRKLVERILIAWSGSVVLDADALNVFTGDFASLAKLLNGRDAVLTPHPAEMGRLLGIETAEIVTNRFDIGMAAAADSGASI